MTFLDVLINISVITCFLGIAFLVVGLVSPKQKWMRWSRASLFCLITSTILSILYSVITF